MTDPAPNTQHSASIAERLTIHPWLPWCVSFAAALALYVATADRGVQWQDSGWQQYRIVTGQFDHPLGLALTHPLQYYLGRLAVRTIPIEPAFAVTLISCLAAAVAVANLSTTLLILTRRISAALLPALALLLSHTFWQHATHTESYALTAALLTGEWLCLAAYANTRRTWLLSLLAFLNGAGLSNHMLAALATPVDLAVIVAAIRRKRMLIKDAVGLGLLWLLGASLYLAAIFARLVATGEFAGTFHAALFGAYASEVLNVSLGWRSLLFSLGFVIYNFPGLTLALAVYALIRKLDVPAVFVRAARWELLLYALFAIRYGIKDQYTFFFPAYMLLAIFSGLALARLLPALTPVRRRLTTAVALLSALWTPALYIAAAELLSSRHAWSSLVGNKPYRDGYQALLLPWGIGQHYASTVNRQAYSLAGTNGLILYEDTMVGFGLRYAQAVEAGLANVTVMAIESHADEPTTASRKSLLVSCLAERRHVVLVPRDRDHPATCVSDANWRRSGDLYILESLNNPTSGPAW